MLLLIQRKYVGHPAATVHRVVETKEGRMVVLTQTAQELLREFTNEQIPLVVRGVEWRCWRCHSSNWVPALIHIEETTDVYSVIQAVSGPCLAYIKECLVLAGSSLGRTIKPRRSKSAGCYLSHGCPRCDALAGAFYLNESLIEAFAGDGVGSLPVLAAFKRPNIEYMLLTAKRDNLHWCDE